MKICLPFDTDMQIRITVYQWDSVKHFPRSLSSYVPPLTHMHFWKSCQTFMQIKEASSVPVGFNSL